VKFIVKAVFSRGTQVEDKVEKEVATVVYSSVIKENNDEEFGK
jgi:hypothetical protein